MPLFSPKQPTTTPNAQSRLNWKPPVVAALTATETMLDGLPIPAAKGCISLVLQVIAATDVAADNEEVLKNLHARYQDLKGFLTSVNESMAPDIPEDVRKDMDNLDLDLKTLAAKWEPLLIRTPRRRDRFMKLFNAQSDRDMLKGFLSETDERVNTFLLRFEVKSWMSTFRETVKTREAAAKAEGAAMKAHAEAFKGRQADILTSMPRALNASYKTPRSGGARTCLPGTRLIVLKAIETWALHPDFNHPPVFWLNGVAGIGKTTIAHTVASRLDALQQLGGSFVFLKTDDQLKDGNLVFPTLAFQLSSFDPVFKVRLAQVLEDDPGCVTESPKTQFEKLIREPLSAISISKPLILILDALDECQADSLEEILWVIVNSVKRVPFLRVFITSRPEGHIREGLAVDDGNATRQKLVLHEDMHVQEEVEKDIRLYLKTSLQEIWQKESQGKWPPEKDLETLVEHSGKLFIYAATMVRFIGGNRALNLKRQLGVLLNVKVGHIPVSDSYRRLDQLYLNILDGALPAELLDDPHYIECFQKVVGSIVLVQKPLPLDAFARFLGDDDVPKIRRTLYHLHSIIIVPDDPSHAVRTYHLSFPNFITSAGRCTNHNAYINAQKQEQYLFLQCLDIMKKFYGPANQSNRRVNIRHNTVDSLDDQVDAEAIDQPPNNQTDSPDNGTVDDFYEGDTSMTPEVRYANNHWCSHLVNIHVKPDVTKEPSEVATGDDVLPPEASEQLINALEQFVSGYLPQWLDRRNVRISSTYGATKVKLAQDTFDIMYNAYRWIGANIDSQQSRDTRQVFKTNTLETCALLFPETAGGYTFGGRVTVPLAIDEYYEFAGYLPYHSTA